MIRLENSWTSSFLMNSRQKHKKCCQKQITDNEISFSTQAFLLGKGSNLTIFDKIDDSACQQLEILMVRITLACKLLVIVRLRLELGMEWQVDRLARGLRHLGGGGGRQVLEGGGTINAQILFWPLVQVWPNTC